MKRFHLIRVISHPIVFICLLLCITFFKVWLCQAQMLQLGGTSIFDDFLYVKEAATIVKGGWLGTYDQYTLIKGSFYPLWIAVMHFLHIPLLVSQQVLYILACLCVCFALKAYYGSGFSFLVYTLLLLNPIMNMVNEWVCRYHIYTSLTLFIVAIVLILHKTQSYRKIILYYVCLGICIAAFYLLREEFAWIIPFLFVMGVSRYAKNVHTSNKKIHNYGLLICLVTVIVFVGGVAYRNYQVYGKFVLNELKQTAFHQVYGDLLRVSHPFVPWVIVPNDVIRKVGEVSPHFAPIARHVLGPRSQWARNISELYMGHPTDEITGSQLIFVLRNAAFDVGYLTSATDADRHFSFIHSEIQQACFDGRLECRRPVLFGFFPLLQESELQRIGRSFLSHAKRLMTLKEVHTSYGFSDIQSHTLLYEMTSPIAVTAFLPSSSSPLYYNITNERIRTIQMLIRLYRIVGSVLFMMGGVAFFVVIAWSMYHRVYPYMFFVLLALGGSSFTLLFLMSYIDAVQFPLETAHYLAPVYPLLFLFSCISLYELLKIEMKYRKQKK